MRFFAYAYTPIFLASLVAGCSSGTQGSVPAAGTTQSVAHAAAPQGIAALSSFQRDLASGRIKAVCPPSSSGIRCLSYILQDTTNAPHSESPNIAGWSATQLQSAYGLSSFLGKGKGDTVALVLWYNNPNLASDLAVYRKQWGLPACTTKSGCLKIVNQTGGKSLPQNDEDAGVEEDLDVDMVSANCPLCKIVYVEADQPEFSDLNIAEKTAEKLAGVVAVSNSWEGGEQSSGESSFSKSGVAITASAGDGGYGVGTPNTYPSLTAVGGTSLSTSKNSRGWSETVWDGTGSGCSEYYSTPSWQKAIEKKLGGCSKRVVGDVSYVADPNTGVAMYDTYGYGGWIVVGGTSVSAPAIAAIYALSGNTKNVPAELAYKNASTLNDVTSGSNGSCSPNNWLCTGETGYDGPTGNGTPNGNNGLSAF